MMPAVQCSVPAYAKNAPPGVAMFSPKILACLKAPGKDNSTHLELTDNALRCVETGEIYPFIHGVPSLYQPSPTEGEEVTRRIRLFYEENPFPNYDGVEDFADLVNKGYHNPFSIKLLKSLGYNKLILECGCGTGQLTHFLQLNNNYTLGIDLSLGSLVLAIDHKVRNQLPRSAFCQMNIFDLAVKDASFDVVISTGVLHHTFDARRAFASIVRKAKLNGIVIVGLYNCYARIPTWVRSKLIGKLGWNIDYVVRSRIRNAHKAEIWIKDQYYNPHETWHSIDEVMGWFEENHIEYLNCVPAILATSAEEAGSMLAATRPGTLAKRITTQLSWLWSISREGALFTMIGRRAGEAQLQTGQCLPSRSNSLG
jgi:SAM-dependent methyltransferase